MSSRIVGNHHITLSTGGAEEDWDFHTKALGLRQVKKTILYDGDEPIYHLYYANAEGDPGAILTSFPMRQQGGGPPGHQPDPGIGLSVAAGSSATGRPPRSAGFATATEALGSSGCTSPTRADSIRAGCTATISAAATGRAASRRSTESRHLAPVITSSIPRDGPLHREWPRSRERLRGRPARRSRWLVRARRMVEIVEDPEEPPGTWFFGEGTVHHWAWDVVDEDNQMGLKGLHRGAWLHRRDRAEGSRLLLSVLQPHARWRAVRVRVHAADRGFLIDEPEDQLGTTVQIPPPFAHLAQEMLDYLEPIEDQR